MARATPEHGSATVAKHGTAGFFGSISAAVNLCAKRAVQMTRKLKPSKPKQSLTRSPLAKSKQLLKTISNTAVTLVQRKKNGEQTGGGGRDVEDEDCGDGGVWQKTILMGDKCEPLDFSGVIYYDCNGKQLNEVPLRSPRASPLPGYLTRVGRT